jgi:hypothetical protein
MKNSEKPKLNWKQKILRDLGRVENLLPEAEFMQDDWPDWVQQMACEYAKTAFPRVNFAKLDDPTANEVGRIVGVKQAAASALDDIELTEKQAEALGRLLVTKWGEKAEEKFMEYLKLFAEGFLPAYERSIRRALASASKQTPREQAEFFKGYAQMVDERPDARATTTTRIYFVMVLHWRLFETLAESGKYSVRELHDLLCKIFGAHLVGDLKTTEKMCERKGLHFRRRGRPVRSDKSDIKAA